MIIFHYKASILKHKVIAPKTLHPTFLGHDTFLIFDEFLRTYFWAIGTAQKEEGSCLWMVLVIWMLYKGNADRWLIHWWSQTAFHMKVEITAFMLDSLLIFYVSIWPETYPMTWSFHMKVEITVFMLDSLLIFYVWIWPETYPMTWSPFSTLPILVA